MANKILVIDDDIRILRLVKNILEMDNLDVEIRQNVEDINLCDFVDYDLILLDVMMPINGLDICKEIRDKIKVPIIFITAKSLEEDFISGVIAGADDYITKPFSVNQLRTRVKMHLRREERFRDEKNIILFDKIKIDNLCKKVFIEDKYMQFTKKEFEIIYTLASNINKIFTLEELYERLYPLSSETQFRSVSEYIYQIRTKFKEYEINPIETVWGGGYRWKK